MINKFAGIDTSTLPRVFVSIWDDDLPSSFDEYSKQRIDRLSNIAIGEIKSNQSKLAELPAYQIEFTNMLVGAAQNEIWTIKDGQVFNIEYLVSPRDYTTDLPIFQKMIDSFKIETK